MKFDARHCRLISINFVEEAWKWFPTNSSTSYSPFALGDNDRHFMSSMQLFKWQKTHRCRQVRTDPHNMWKWLVWNCPVNLYSGERWNVPFKIINQKYFILRLISPKCLDILPQGEHYDLIHVTRKVCSHCWPQCRVKISSASSLLGLFS